MKKTISAIVLSMMALGGTMIPVTAFAGVTQSTTGVSHGSDAHFQTITSSTGKTQIESVINSLFSGNVSVSATIIKTNAPQSKTTSVSTVRGWFLDALNGGTGTYNQNEAIATSGENGQGEQSGNMVIKNNTTSLDLTSMSSVSQAKTASQINSRGTFVIDINTSSYKEHIVGDFTETKTGNTLVPYLPSSKDGISLSGKSLYNVAPVLYQGTTYLPIYDVMQALKKDGIANTWNGTAWNITGVKDGLATKSDTTEKSIQLDGKTVETCDLITFNKTTYMPIYYVMQALKGAGKTVTWNGNTMNIG